MTDNLQNWVEDTAEIAETQPEQGTVVDDMVDTAPEAETDQVVEDGSEDKEAQKAEMRKNQLNNIETQAKKLEKETGLSLEDLLLAATGESIETPEPVKQPQDEDFDKELFNKMVDERFQEQYGSKLSKFAEYASKIEAKDIVSKLPADYKDFESEIVKFMEANPYLAKTEAGVKTAYYAVKGINADNLATKAVQTKENEINTKEEVKSVSYVESGKSETQVKKGQDLTELMNLSPDEYSKLPSEIREQILRSL